MKSFKSDIRDVFHYVVGEGSHVKPWAKVVLFPFIIYTAFLCCIYVVLDHTITIK